MVLKASQAALESRRAEERGIVAKFAFAPARAIIPRNSSDGTRTEWPVHSQHVRALELAEAASKLRYTLPVHRTRAGLSAVAAAVAGERHMANCSGLLAERERTRRLWERLKPERLWRAVGALVHTRT